MKSQIRATPIKSFLIGLPSAGKTTFLAALWHTLESAEIETGIELNSMPKESGYLNQIRDDWSNVIELARTNISLQQFIEIELKRKGSQTPFDFVVPDLSGEMFEQHWAERQIDESLLTLLGDSAGGILMVHPGNCHEPAFISEVREVIGALADSQLDGRSTERVEAQLKDWDLKLAPTQVKLVDLLQIVGSTSKHSCLKLSVVVSAWDLLENQNITPEAWVKIRLPLLHQYLRSNSQSFRSKYFGLSALGGAIEEAEKLRVLSRAAMRVSVDDGGGNGAKITDLIDWILPDKF